MSNRAQSGKFQLMESGWGKEGGCQGVRWGAVHTQHIAAAVLTCCQFVAPVAAPASPFPLPHHPPLPSPCLPSPHHPALPSPPLPPLPVHSLVGGDLHVEQGVVVGRRPRHELRAVLHGVEGHGEPNVPQHIQAYELGHIQQAALQDDRQLPRGLQAPAGRRRVKECRKKVYEWVSEWVSG